MVTRTTHRPGARIQRLSAWWAETALGALAYWIYSVVRDAHGRSGGVNAAEVAFAHGRNVRHAEGLVGLNVEDKVQHAFLHVPWVLRLLGGFYGSAHFVVTFAVLTFLLIRRQGEYTQWRTRLFATTVAALVLFALYPTAPPRLLPGGDIQDTLTTIGGLWSYNNGVLERISDPFAAMPSLHLAWSCWAAAALAGTVGATWTPARRRLLWLYPAAVTVTVLATGAHWLLDAVAGAGLFTLVCLTDRVVRLYLRRRALLLPSPRPLAGVLVEPQDAFAD